MTVEGLTTEIVNIFNKRVREQDFTPTEYLDNAYKVLENCNLTITVGQLCELYSDRPSEEVELDYLAWMLRYEDSEDKSTLTEAQADLCVMLTELSREKFNNWLTERNQKHLVGTFSGR